MLVDHRSNNLSKDEKKDLIKFYEDWLFKKEKEIAEIKEILKTLKKSR